MRELNEVEANLVSGGDTVPGVGKDTNSSQPQPEINSLATYLEKGPN